MIETKKEELDLEEFEIKEEIVSIKEEICPSPTVEETCTEKTVIKGNLQLLKALKGRVSLTNLNTFGLRFFRLLFSLFYHFFST